MRILRRPTPLVVAAFAGLSIGAVIAAARTEPFGVYVVDGRPTGTMDFAAVRAFTRAIWSGALARDGTSAYTLAAYQRATDLWLGSGAVLPQPSVYSPTMLWVMAPFSALPARLAFVLWSAAAVGVTIWMMVRTPGPWPALLALITPVTLYAIAVGQTALLTTAALFALMTTRRDAARTAILWLLTAKPTLAVAAGTALLALGRWRAVVAALVLTAVAALAVTPWLGRGWIGDYVRMLTAYDRSAMPDSFGWAIVPAVMSNLRAALYCDLGVDDHVASAVSAAGWLVALVAIVAAARLGWTSAWTTWSLSILAFLLLCPHVTATEELALFLIPATVAAGRTRPALAGAIIALVLVGLLLSPAIGPARGVRPSYLFFAKALLVAPVLAIAATNDQGAGSVRA